MIEHETRLLLGGEVRVAGVDEAGRGPLAGPVIAAAVVLDPSLPLPAWRDLLDGLTDSKKLSSSRRQAFEEILKAHPLVHIGVGEASVVEIDRINILNATHLAMKRALEALPLIPDFALVDGRPVRGLRCPHLALVKGDSRSLSIAAASVIAKVTRDRLMLEISARYPFYGFASHKGYGTPEHCASLQHHGPCPEHRRSFRPVSDCLSSVLALSKD